MNFNPAIRDDALGKAYVAVMRAVSGRPTQGMLLVGRHRSARIAHLDRIGEILSTTNARVVRVRMSKGRSLPALLCSQLQDRQGQAPARKALLEVDLMSLFVAIGTEAAQAGTSYAILIDDMHSVETQQLSALIGALHRIAQSGLPVVLIGAGSPALRRRIGSAKPYAERMFEFLDLGG